jgi:AcrR family transcriptional regulator
MSIGSERRRARTRAALLEAGLGLLALRNIDGISIDEIVAAADVAKGSFYNHFADKGVFARQIGAAVRGQAERLAAGANAAVTDPAERVARALCVFVRFATEHPDSARVLWRLNAGSTMADAPINRHLTEDLSRGIATRRFAAVDLEAGVLLVIGAVVVAMRHVLEEHVSTPAASIAAQMAGGLLRGLGVGRAESRRLSQRSARQVFAGAAGATTRD